LVSAAKTGLKTAHVARPNEKGPGKGEPTPTVPVELAGATRWPAQLVERLGDQGIDVAVDIGLGAAGAELAGALGGPAITVPAAADALPHLAARLHMLGCAIDWPRLLAGRGQLTSLPAYPWQRRRYWVATDVPPVEEIAAPAAITETVSFADFDRLMEFVLDQVADVLGDDADIDTDQGFFELGMDSVMSVSLKTRMEHSFGIELPATLAFDFPTPRTLADHLRQPERPAGAVAIDEHDQIDALSDAELADRMLLALTNSEDLLRGHG